MGFADFDTADRMRRTLRVTGVSVAEMAEYLEVSREAISTWLTGRVQPRKTTLMAWALKTGAPFEWLSTGASIEDDSPNRPPRD